MASKKKSAKERLESAAKIAHDAMSRPFGVQRKVASDINRKYIPSFASEDDPAPKSEHGGEVYSPPKAMGGSGQHVYNPDWDTYHQYREHANNAFRRPPEWLTEYMVSEGLVAPPAREFAAHDQAGNFFLRSYPANVYGEREHRENPDEILPWVRWEDVDKDGSRLPSVRPEVHTNGRAYSDWVGVYPPSGADRSGRYHSGEEWYERSKRKK